MSSNKMFRIGGVSAFLSIALILADTVFTGVASPASVPVSSRIINSAAAIVLLPFSYALYIIYRDIAKSLSQIAWFEVLGATILYIVSLLILGLQPLALYNIAFTTANMVPSLLYGILMAQQPQAGMPRTLGILGIIAGGLGVVRYVFLTLGGGDWTNLSNPALQPVIFISYMAWIALGVVWLIWTGVLLLRQPK